MRRFLVLLTVLFTFSGNSQISFSGAKEAANKLNTGLLVVRLYETSNELEFLIENGRNDEATVLQSEIDKENQAIRDAFVNEYTFGDVVFMNADHSEKLILGEWEGILQDGQGNTVDLDTTKYLVADISNTKRRGLTGLNIWEWKNDEWVHPPNPFPAHISQYGFLGLYKRTYSEMVSNFNVNFVNVTRENLEILKEGVLIVRLSSNLEQIERLKAEGRTEEAEELNESTQKRNSEIRRAFADFYTYGRVYFMDSKYSSQLIEENWDRILTNENEAIENVAVQPYMVADFSRLKSRDLNGLNIVKWDEDKEEWTHPESPFPYFISEYTALSRAERTPDMMVNILNNELIELE